MTEEKMMENPLISIVMPVYNAEKYLEQALQAVADQTYQNWEIIAVNDCSTDRSSEILESFRHTLNLTVINNDRNRGVAYSRNTAVEHASAELIAFLDSDDDWDPTKLEKQVALMQEHPKASLIFTGSAFMDTTGEKLSYTLHVPEKIGFAELKNQNLISCSSVLVKKDLITKHPFPDSHMIHEDFAVWLNILKEVPYAYGIDEALLIYRLTDGSKSHNKLAAAHMNWNTYRYVGMSLVSSLHAMVQYTLRGLKKYSNIRKAGKNA